MDKIKALLNKLNERLSGGLLKKKHGIVLVIVFLSLFVIWGSCSADQLEVGPAQVGDNISGTMLTLTKRVNDLDFTLGYITEQDFSVCDRPDCDWTVQEQIFIGAEWLVGDRLKFGIGPYYFQNRDRIATTNFRVGLSLEYRFTRRFGVRARHFSNAGTGPDLELCNETGCYSNNWNNGQDSWLRLVWYF
jgi:hypothetical protein